MKKLRKFDPAELSHEYGLDGKRLLPWPGMQPPFGGAYCIVRPGDTTTGHVNEPVGEEEMFICISGSAVVVCGEEKIPVAKGDTVYIPAGEYHYVENPEKEDFEFYAVWWNKESASEYLQQVSSAHE
jgi:oxalate decarboxylase/phosphoglucose isomerase-like protein (cupin superfamily)